MPSTPRTDPLVSVIMGSARDGETVRPALAVLEQLDVPFEARVVSAHRTPHLMAQFAEQAEQRGIKVIIAAAGGAAHLPGMVAAYTILPVLGIPVPATALQGVDSLLSIAQMPRGVPVGCLAIGQPGAANAGFLAAQIVALHDEGLRTRLRQHRRAMHDKALSEEVT